MRQTYGDVEREQQCNRDTPEKAEDCTHPLGRVSEPYASATPSDAHYLRAYAIRFALADAYCSAINGQQQGPFYQDNVALGTRCVQANENVLRVMGGWNMCVNLQCIRSAFSLSLLKIRAHNHVHEVPFSHDV